MKRDRKKAKKDDNPRPVHQLHGSSSNSNPGNSETNMDPILEVFNPNPNMGSHQNQYLNVGSHQNQNPNMRSHQNPNVGSHQNQNPNMRLHQNPNMGLLQYSNPNKGLNQNSNNNPSMGLPSPSSSIIPQPDPLSTVIPQPQGDDLGITNDIFNYDFVEDPYEIGDLLDETRTNMGGNRNYNGCGPSGVNGERFAQETLLNNDHASNNSGFGNPVKLSQWPSPPQPHVCSCCHVLREIKTYNGKKVRNLEVHGRIGMFTHAVLEKFDYGNNMIPENHEYIMYDFCNESIDAVKNFLVQFCEQTKREGYVLVFDPLAKFYEALSVGLNESNAGFDNNSGDQDSSFGNLSPEEVSESEEIRNGKRKRNGKAIAKEKGKGKSSLAAQRERTAKMTKDDLVEYFHLPLMEVAKRLEVCPTVIKRICRKGGMTRWPYRRVKGLNNQIAKKKAEIQGSPYPDRAVLMAEIHMLEYELAGILGRPNA